MQINLSDHFDYSRLLRFTLPSIAMVVFTSIYGVVDGFFVANYAGKQAFAAVNLSYPVIMILGTLGMMFGSGGSALVAAAQGRGRKKLANDYFSLITYSAFISGVVLVALFWFLLEPLMKLMGATGGLLENSVLYGHVMMISLPAFILQSMFQILFITAGKPKLGFCITVGAGVANMVLDFVLVGILGYGLVGAGIATVVSEFFGGVAPLFYFFHDNGSTLRLKRTRWVPEALFKTCFNGSSELLSGISSSLIGALYNFQLMKFVGENGVAAFGVVMYLTFIFCDIFVGYCNGVAPIISNHFGANDKDELRNLFKRCVVIIAILGVALFTIAEMSAPILARFFVGQDSDLFEMTQHACRIVSFCFLLSGFGIFGSSLFTALNNGVLSAIISVGRSVVFGTMTVMLLPIFFGVDGIWLAVWATEIASIIVVIYFVIRKRKNYGYL